MLWCTRQAVAKACEFLLGVQRPDGGWGESYLSCQDKVRQPFHAAGPAKHSGYHGAMFHMLVPKLRPISHFLLHMQHWTRASGGANTWQKPQQH